MKKLCSWFLTIAVLLSLVPAGAVQFSFSVSADEGYYTYTVTNGKATITDVEENISGDVTVPSVLGGYPVTAIGGWSFENCKTITSVVIPQSVTSLGNGVFAGCTSLVSVSLPNDIFRITVKMFSECTALTSITIPDGVEYIDENAFLRCTSLASVRIGSGVRNIDYRAFDHCTALTSLTIDSNNQTYHSAGNCIINTASKSVVVGFASSVIPADGSVTSIGYEAFAYCDSLTSITIPDSVTSIGYRAFYNCVALHTIVLHDSVETISEEAFLFTKYYETDANWENDVLYIGNYLIRGPFDNVDECVIREGTKSIAASAFAKNDTIMSVTVPDSVTRIGQSAFANCTALQTIELPNYGFHIGPGAFWNTAYYNDTANWQDNVLYIGNHIIDGRDVVGDTYQIREGTKSIASRAFQSCNTLQSVTIPDGVEVIGDESFYRCNALQSIVIPDSVTRIGERAFIYCNPVTSLVIGSGLTHIDSDTFPNVVTSIDVSDENPVYHSDGNCLIHTASKTVVLGCETSVIPDDGSVTIIGKGAFSSCEFPIMNIPDSVTSIGDYAFSYCDLLRWLNIGDGVKSIGEYAFSGCNALREVIIPNGVTRIGKGAFAGNNRLQIVTIPASVTHIERYAFGDFEPGTNHLSEVRYGGSKADFAKVTVGENNGQLFAAPWQYNAPVHSYGDDNLCDLCGEDKYLSLYSYRIDGNNEVTIYGMSDDVAGKIVIPSALQGYPVTRIDDKAFIDQNFLKDIVIPDSVISIGVDAFLNTGCHNNVANWENGGLYLDRCLIAVDKTFRGEFCIKEGTRIIADGAFKDCTALDAVIIPNSVKSIGTHAFRGCTALETVAVPEGVINLGAVVFEDCTALASIAFPDSLTRVGSDVVDNTAYYNDETNWENGLLYVGNHLVGSGYPYEENCVIREGTKTIAKSALSHHSITSIVIPDSVVWIGAYAFHQCRELATVTIPPHVTRIENEAFSGCDALISITLPVSLMYIGMGAFEGAPLEEVYYSGSEADRANMTIVHYEGEFVINNQSLLDAKWHYSVSCAHMLADDNVCDLCGWDRYAGEYIYTVENGEVTIQGMRVSAVGKVTLPAVLNGYPVTRIGERAFYDCDRITSVAFPESLKYIDDQAFSSCERLVSVTIPHRVVAVGLLAFDGDSSLRSITLPDSIKTIGEGAFWSTAYSNDRENWDGDLLYIGNHLVDALRAEGDTCYIIREGTRTIADCVFRFSEDDVVSVVLPKSVKYIGKDMFGEYGNFDYVYYGGSKADRNAIGFSAYNRGFDQPVWYYNTCTVHTYPSECATQCTACDWVRIDAPEDHVYANETDTVCDRCGETGALVNGTCGDVNGSGRVDSTDARLVLQLAVGKIKGDTINTSAADVDGNRKVDSTDARLILQYAVGKISSFPAAK